MDCYCAGARAAKIVVVKNELEVPLFWDGSRSRFKGTAPATGMTKIRVNREEENFFIRFYIVY